MARLTDRLSWEDVQCLSRAGLQEFLRAPFPNGAGLENDFAQFHFREFDGEVLADLKCVQDLQDAGLTALQADHFWTFLQCFKFTSDANKRLFKRRRIEAVGRYRSLSRFPVRMTRSVNATESTRVRGCKFCTLRRKPSPTAKRRIQITRRCGIAGDIVGS
jgi:hypothetical protein